MVFKGCFPECRGSYDIDNKLRLYRFPSNDERNSWIFHENIFRRNRCSGVLRSKEIRTSKSWFPSKF